MNNKKSPQADSTQRPNPLARELPWTAFGPYSKRYLEVRSLLICGSILTYS